MGFRTSALSIFVAVAWLLTGCAEPSTGTRGKPRPVRSIPDHTRTYLPPTTPLSPDGADTQLREATALHLASSVPLPADLHTWVKTVARAGLTTLVVDAVSEGGANFQTTRARVVRDVFGDLIRPAHEQRVAVFAAISLRSLSWLEADQVWNDARYDPAIRRAKPSSALDLFHPAYQDYLGALLTDLAASGVDGVLLRLDPPLSPYEGLSPSAVKAFERDFNVEMDPQKLFVPLLSVRPADSPDFWRWSGWKAREIAELIGRLTRTMRARAPLLRVALEVHPEAASDPVTALARYGEDVLEAKRNRVDIFVLAPSAGGDTPAAAIRRLTELIGDPRRIWVTAPVGTGDAVTLATRVNPAADRAAWERGIGLLYRANHESASAPAVR